MLALDSLAIDLIFQANATLDPEKLVEALGGPEVAATRQMLDPDMQDPRFEMQLSPSMPFRRRGERRLMILDDSVAPMRKDPRTEFHIKIDLREEKQRLIAMCETAPIRLGRINALGSWGDAVIVAREARDLRAICLIPWALDPTIDVDGRKRASRLTQPQFEEKLAAYEKRLDELDEGQILSDVGPATFTRQGDLLIVDVLEEDGTWDLRKSLAMESALAAVHRFSILPGAPASDEPPGPPDAPKAAETEGVAETETEAEAGAGTEGEAGAQAEAEAGAEAGGDDAVGDAPTGPTLRITEIGERVVLVFPAERFDLDVAVALGKGDYEAIIRPADGMPGATRDRVMRDGAEFIAPVEFLSEVFLEGKPLSRPQFDNGAEDVGGARAMRVHYPRLGPVTLVDVPELGRFVSSETDAASILRVLREAG